MFLPGVNVFTYGARRGGWGGWGVCGAAGRQAMEKSLSGLYFRNRKV